MGGAIDPDTIETAEWIDSLRAVLHHEGAERATFLLDRLTDEAQHAGATIISALNSPYVNTIPPEREEHADWDRQIEHRIRLNELYLSQHVVSPLRGCARWGRGPGVSLRSTPGYSN